MEEIREIARALRRHLEYLEEAGSMAVAGAPQSLPPAELPAPPPVEESTDPVARKLQKPIANDTDTRRSNITEHGTSRVPFKDRDAALEALRKDVNRCKLCKLCEGRTNGVPGEGSSRARVMFVGEAPGADEDAQGRPFVGRSGQLLTKIIESGMGLKREEVYIANIAKCRPPENRDPEPDEVAACVPYLYKQIEIIDPDVIITVGRYSMRELAGVGEKDTISRVRGKVYRVHGRAVIPTFHPAYLLRNPPEKVKVWADIQLAMKELGLPILGDGGKTP